MINVCLLMLSLASVASNKIKITNDDVLKGKMAAKCIFQYIKNNELIDATKSILLINSMHGTTTWEQSFYEILYEEYGGSVILIKSTKGDHNFSNEIVPIYQFVGQVVWFISKSKNVQYETFVYFENVSQKSKTHALRTSKTFEHQNEIEDISKILINKQFRRIVSKMEKITENEIANDSWNIFNKVTRNCTRDQIALKVSHTCNLNGHNFDLIHFNGRKNVDSCPLEVLVHPKAPYIYFRNDLRKYAGIEYNLVETIAKTLILNISYTWLNDSIGNTESANKNA